MPLSREPGGSMVNSPGFRCLDIWKFVVADANSTLSSAWKILVSSL